MRIPSGLRGQARNFAKGLIRLVAARRTSAVPHSIGGRSRGLFSRGEEGGALVEIALTLPPMLAILTGLCAFGVAFSNQLTLTQAVSTGGQYLSQIRTSSTNPCADTFNAIKGAAPNLTPANIAVTITMNGTTPTQTGNTCSGAQSDLTEGTPVVVSATYPCGLSIYNVKFASGCQLTAQVTEYEY